MWGMSMPSRDDLHPYQERAIKFIKDNRRCMLALDMGLGKSISTLTAISDALDSFAASRVLVIAPLRVANVVWSSEASKWDHTRHLRISIATGPAPQRIAALKTKADVTMINRENVPWLIEQCGKRWPYDFVVIDESDSFKSASSQRFKALKRVIPVTTYMVLLTGTPAPNGLLDLWSQIYLIDAGMRLGRTMSAYKQRFFESDYMGYKFVPIAGSSEKINALLSDVVLSMKASDYLELPDRIDIIEKVDIGEKALARYKAFENELFMELPDGDIEALSAAVLANKLLQMANGAIYYNERDSVEVIHDAKLNALAEIIESNPGENILVAYNYQHDLARLRARFPQAVILSKDASVVDRWNAGKISLLLAHPKSAGHGLNLQNGGCIAVWFGLSWGLGEYQQFNARLHRQGQGRPVRIIHLIADSTIDSRVIDVLGCKDATQRKLLESLRAK